MYHDTIHAAVGPLSKALTVEPHRRIVPLLSLTNWKKRQLNNSNAFSGLVKYRVLIWEVLCRKANGARYQSSVSYGLRGQWIREGERDIGTWKGNVIKRGTDERGRLEKCRAEREDVKRTGKVMERERQWKERQIEGDGETEGRERGGEDSTTPCLCDICVH